MTAFMSCLLVMNNSNVLLEAILLFECFVTLIAFKLSLVAMNSLMLFQLPFGIKLLLALITAIILFLLMHSLNVLLEFFLERK